jgi:hypothetical protein
MSKFLRTLCRFVSLCTPWVAASGQRSTAAAFGNVTDPSGAEIPNATVAHGAQACTIFRREPICA